jgi:8-oxo-dGTP pyrophosphatase MutT (NUDIX family)
MEVDPFKIKNSRPIISYGIVLYTYVKSENLMKYLFIRRKNTFGFIDFIKGNYTISNQFHLQNMFDEMTLNEKTMLKNNSFNELWCDLWDYDKNNANFENNSEYIKLKNKFNKVKEIKLMDEMINQSQTLWVDPEWEFPKGRINSNEKHLECSIREFEEETGIKKDMINVIDNILPFEENFIGTNYKSYTYKYYLSYMKYDDYLKTKLDKYQKSEVSKLEWVTVEECIEKIRPYNLEKINLITNINNVLLEYKLYNN